jgi:hypothetical protein
VQPAREQREGVEAASAMRTTAYQRRSKPLKEVAARRNQAARNLVDQQFGTAPEMAGLGRQGTSSSIKSGMSSCGRILYRLPASKEMP